MAMGVCKACGLKITTLYKKWVHLEGDGPALDADHEAKPRRDRSK